MTSDRIIEQAAAFLRDAAACILAFMMFLTTGDIVLRWIANSPIFGAFELVELSLVSLVFLSLPKVFIGNKHIVVNALDGFFPKPMLRWLNILGALLSLSFVVLMGVFMFRFAHDAYTFEDRTMDMSMPVIWFWVPVYLGVIASVVVCLVVARRLIRRG
ncbi:MAG: TRAP transporter small permease [Rhodospirillales bacterium]|nr:TRAP transporter small permease [Rhodospirillales bacterium]